VKNIQIIDGADNATFSIFQATDQEYAEIFLDGRDIELAAAFCERVGDDRASEILGPIWDRPILKRDAMGIHGTLYYDWDHRRESLPATLREVDWPDSAINDAQRKLFRLHR